MDLKALIKEKQKNLDAVPEKLLSEIQKVEKEIYAKLITLLDQLKRDADGNVIISKQNIAIAADISNEIKAAVLSKDYLSALREFVKGIDEQAILNDKYFKSVIDGFKESAAADAILETSKKATLEQLVGSGMEAEIVKPVQDMINTTVASGGSWRDLATRIKDFATGEGDDAGKLTQYSSQVAQDAFTQSDRAYMNVIAEENDMEWYLYSGTEQDNSRPFCAERKGKYFHYKEIEGWADDEWQGKADGTNEQTIFILAGGYRCIDSILPVSIADVPNEVIERNIQNGNYTP